MRTKHEYLDLRSRSGVSLIPLQECEYHRTILRRTIAFTGRLELLFVPATIQLVLSEEHATTEIDTMVFFMR